MIHFPPFALDIEEAQLWKQLLPLRRKPFEPELLRLRGELLEACDPAGAGVSGRDRLCANARVARVRAASDALARRDEI
jgi:hypothetical protein